MLFQMSVYCLQITNVCPPGSLLLAAAIKYLPILFELWVFTSGTVSHLKLVPNIVFSETNVCLYLCVWVCDVGLL